MPMLASFAVFLSLSSIALRGLGGFPGEFMILLGVFHRGWTAAAHAVPLQIIAVLSLGGVILGAWYMLGMCRRVFFGPLRESPLLPLNPIGDCPDFRVSENGTVPLDANIGSAPSLAAEGSGVVRDLSAREIFCLAPLAAAILWIGLQPSLFLDRMAPTLNDLMKPAMEAAEKEMQSNR
jgi:NADH-quinone oxidoreductase subunit M